MRQHPLETRIPPPVVMLLAGGLAWLCARYLPAASLAVPFRPFVVALVALGGLAMNLLPKLSFDRAGTTVNPLDPTLASRLVTTGVYRHTRNPMYVGQAMLLLAWTLWLQNACALLAVPAFVLYITRFQILPEERHLAVRFPAEYEALRRQARRWL
jgi:protein-S-isoprenylcysteine O-methyltransferase Ste14